MNANKNTKVKVWNYPFEVMELILLVNMFGQTNVNVLFIHLEMLISHLFKSKYKNGIQSIVNVLLKTIETK